MFKTFIAGIMLGVVGAVAVLYTFSAVDQHREASIITVEPNGVNTERFHVSLPADRIALGASGAGRSLPPGVDWPANPAFAGLNVELFKLRNAHNTVVGVASRIVATDAAAERVIEWLLHLPARGSVYVTMEPVSVDGDRRRCLLRQGTREFATLSGGMTERWIAAPGSGKGYGRIELKTGFSGASEVR